MRYDGVGGASSAKARRSNDTDGTLFSGLQSTSRTLPVYPGSTISPPSFSLRKLINTIDKGHMIHIALNWIAAARHSSLHSDVIAPQLSRRAPRQMERQGKGDASMQDEDVGTASFLDLHEERRARTLDELEVLWCTEIVRHKAARVSLPERILEVDWPHGITFAMVATLAFEALRAKRTSREWHVVCLDYADDEEHKAVMGDKRGPARVRLYEHVTPKQLKERFSAEFSNFCMHAVFLDNPIKPLKVRISLDDDVSPVPQDWTRPFTHLRVAHPSCMCGDSLHFLHIPHSPWFMVSGMMGRGTSDMREMALTALANALGARRMRTPNKKELSGIHVGKMGQLKGRDPLALRDILLAGGLVRDHDEIAGGMPGGKGRAMRRGEAEDGPLVRAEKRQRDDTTGLYEDVERKEKSQVCEPALCEEEQRGSKKPDGSSLVHPAQLRREEKQRRSEKRKRDREVGDLFGHAPSPAEGDGATPSKSKGEDLPRLERISYELYLPFPTLPGYGNVPRELVRKHPIKLRLDGLHVLAGLRSLVGAGLDGDEARITDVTSQARSKHIQDASKNISGGLPSWLTEVRGTRIRVGLGEDDHQDDSEKEGDGGDNGNSKV